MAPPKKKKKQKVVETSNTASARDQRAANRPAKRAVFELHTIMAGKRDQFWKYGLHLNYRFQCNFCKKEFNGGLMQLIYHLSGLIWPSVEFCNQVPEDVQLKAYVTTRYNLYSGKVVEICTQAPMDVQLKADTAIRNSGLIETMQSWQRKLNSTGRDWFSELPDEIVVHILSFLPTLDAVRTVLLRRFGKLWTHVHSLYFHQCRLFSRSNQHDEDLSPTSDFFLNFVWNVLRVHRGPIRAFHLEIYEGSVEIERCIEFVLLRNNVETLTVIVTKCWLKNSSFTMPHFVFRSRSLVSLKCQGCKIKGQSQVHLESLREFNLQYSHVGGEMLEKIISGCPLLEKLVICNPRLGNSIQFRIASPRIKSLRLRVRAGGRATVDCPNLTELDISSDLRLRFTEVLSVSNANLELYGCSLTESSAHILLSYLVNLRNAEALELSALPMQQLAYCSIKELVFPHNRWKHLILKPYLSRPVHILGICGLLRNSPCLEELTIRFGSGSGLILDWPKVEITSVREAMLDSPCAMLQLKTITMCAHEKLGEIHLQLIEFLLRSAPSLDTLIFESIQLIGLPSTEVLDFLHRMFNLPRVSTKARIRLA